MQNSVFWIRITRLYESQTPPIVFFMQNNVISIRITSLYVSQTSSVAFVCKTATLGPQLKVSVGPRPHLSFCACKNMVIITRNTSLNGSPTSPVVLCMQNSVIGTRITSLHGSQTSPVVLCMQNWVICIRNTNLYGSQTSPVVLVCKTASFESELQDSMNPRPHLWCFACRTT